MATERASNRRVVGDGEAWRAEEPLNRYALRLLRACLISDRQSARARWGERTLAWISEKAVTLATQVRHNSLGERKLAEA